MNSSLKRNPIYSKSDLHALKIPHHVAIVMDGNGRWAKARGKGRIYGHSRGVESIRSILDFAKEIGISYLTLWAFSVDNWKRPRAEVRFLMKLLEKYIDDERENLIKDKVRLRILGNLDDLPMKVRKKLISIMEETKNFERLNLNIALSYGGREELIRAFKNISDKILGGTLSRDEINDQVIESHLFTAEIPDPDLIIRTSGELRLSNFFIWQSAYSELYFSSVLWPDFSPEHFWEALLQYSQRERRFGDIQ